MRLHVRFQYLSNTIKMIKTLSKYYNMIMIRKSFVGENTHNDDNPWVQNVE